jgi:hypothetical protein
MRPEMIIIASPFGDDAAGMIETEEQAFVQKFVAHAAVEGFDMALRTGTHNCNERSSDLRRVLRQGHACSLLKSQVTVLIDLSCERLVKLTSKRRDM